MDDDFRLLQEKLLKAWRFFYKRGFIDGFGHISARSSSPELILISRHALGPKASTDDFVPVDLQGRPAKGNPSLPAELPIHLEIYKMRPDVGSIGHFHCLYATAFSMTDCSLRPSYFLASIFKNGIPVHNDSRLINDAERGVALAKTLGPLRAALLKAHGAVATGADVEEMVAVAFILEDNARRISVSASLGKPTWLEDEVVEQVADEILRTRGPFRRIWAWCESESVE